VEVLLGILSPENIVALLTLTLLEIVLGVDNLVFIAVICARLPPERQKLARRLGLFAAMIMRIALLCGIDWIRNLTGEAIATSLLGREIRLSWRDLILIAGGLVLMFKSVREIHHASSGPKRDGARTTTTLAGAVFQIMLMDLVFSLDSVITAVGMSEHLPTMIAAVIASVGVMVFAAEPISTFVDRRRSVKILALSFLLLIGVMLVAEGFGTKVSKGYIYFAMGFALAVEMLNYRADRRESSANPTGQS
jgi:predicted tellurium resistance membrane protein TerC